MLLGAYPKRKESDILANFNIPQELIDTLAKEEVNALLDGLRDKDQRNNLERQ